MRRFLPILALPFLATCGAAAPQYTIKMPEQRAKLPNGIRVILLPDPTTDLVEVDVRYEVGSNEDPPGKEGLAHLVEHLMFQQRQAGADKPPLGVVLGKHSLAYNAFTNWDTTHYQTLGKKDELDTLVGLEATRLVTGCQTIPQGAFEREREVVRNEIRQRTGSPEGQAEYQILADVYPKGHPYARMPGGDDESISAITLDDVCKFMNDYYVPERATVIIAGNVTEETAKRPVDQWLAALPPKKPAPRVQIPTFELPHKTMTHEMDVEEPSVLVVWRMPPTYSSASRAVRFGVSGLFGRTASAGDRYEFATEVRPQILGGALDPVVVVQIGLRDESKVDEAIAAALRSGKSAHRGWDLADSRTYDELRNRMIAGLAESLESITVRAVRYAEWAQFAPEGGGLGPELAAIRKLDGSQIKQAVAATLDPDKALVIVIKPRKNTTKYQRARLRFSGSDTPQRENFPVDISEAAAPIGVPARSTSSSRAKRFELANGMHVVLLPSETQLPVLTADLIFAVGDAMDPIDRIGLADLAATELWSPQGMHVEVGGETEEDAFGRAGIALDPYVTNDHTVFEVHGLGIYLDLSVKGLERMIRTAYYNQDSLEMMHRRYAFAMKRISRRSEAAFDRALATSIYGDKHPYGLTASATPETIGRIGRDAVVEWNNRYYWAKNATLVITGAFDPKQAEALVRETFGEWKGGDATPAIAAPPAARSGPIYMAVEGENIPLVQVRIAYPAPGGIDDSYAARAVLTEMLNHRMGVVRDKLGASYGVYARLATNVAGGMYVVAGGIDAERGAEGLKAMRDGIDALRHAEGFLEDFVRARRVVLERLVVDSNDSRALANKLARIAMYRLSPTFDDELVQKVATLTPQQVVKLVNQELRPELEVVVCLGGKGEPQKAFAGAGMAPVKVIKE